MRGSHRAGRIDHFRVGDQVGADPDRVAALTARFETVPFEGEPGDVVFFHCNVLHTSAPNSTDRSRELLLVAYNARRNDPVKAHHHPGYTPIDLVADDEVERRAGRYDGEKRTFMAARQDRTGEKLERIRLQQLFDAARAAGISVAYLSKLERDVVKRPSPHVLHQLGEALSVPYADLMRLSGYRVPGEPSAKPGNAVGMALFADLTDDERDELVEYLAWYRARQRSGRGPLRGRRGGP